MQPPSLHTDLMFSPSVCSPLLTPPLTPCTSADAAEPGEALQHAGTQPPRPLPEAAGFWRHVANLTERLLEHSPHGNRVLTLKRDELTCLSEALKQADLNCIPPDHHTALMNCQTVLRTSVGEGASTRGLLAYAGDRLEELSGLLQDVLITSSRRQQGDWIPLDPQDRELLCQLGRWMCGGGAARYAERSAVGRQLLQQAAGLLDELHLGSDASAPELPNGNLLHALMDSGTRAHVTLPGTADAVSSLQQALSALPLRTWRLAEKDTLAWTLQHRPPNLRTLDLRPWRNTLDDETGRLLRQAATELPNLAQLLLPSQVPAGVLGDTWTPSRQDDAWQYTRSDRPDGLALLDAAVRQWDGYIVGTRQAIRWKASHPDAASLLAFAARLGQRPPTPVVCDQLLEMLTRAANDDNDLHRYAQALREWEGRSEDPARVLAQVHQQLKCRPSSQPSTPSWLAGGSTRPKVPSSLALQGSAMMGHSHAGARVVPPTRTPSPLVNQALSPTMPVATSTPLLSPSQSGPAVTAAGRSHRAAPAFKGSAFSWPPMLHPQGVNDAASLRSTLSSSSSHTLADIPSGEESVSDSDSVDGEDPSLQSSRLESSESAQSLVWSATVAEETLPLPRGFNRQQHAPRESWEGMTSF